MDESTDATKESGEAVKDGIGAMKEFKEMRKEVTSSSIMVRAMDWVA